MFQIFCCVLHFLVDRKGNYTSCFSACLSIVVETELEIGIVSRAHLPSDFFEIWFQGSQQYGLGPFRNFDFHFSALFLFFYPILGHFGIVFKRQ